MHSNSSISLFGTCVVDLFFPQAGMSALKILEREGIQVNYPQAQSCCGQPAYTSGYSDEARRVALAQIAAFPGEDPIVVLSGSCAGMMKHHYPTLFQGMPEEEIVRQFSKRIIEFTAYLLEVLNIELHDLGPAESVALHTSCTARREMGTLQNGRELLRRLDKIDLKTHNHESECCGFGGTFSVRHPDISAAMVQDKTAALRQCGASKVISADCGCLLNITGALQKQQAHPENKAAFAGLHIAELIWQRTGGKSQ